MVQVRKLVLAIAAASALSSGMAHALALGDLTLKSTLNQPLVAEIELLDAHDLNAGQVVPSLATSADFAQAGVDRRGALDDLTFTPVINANGKSVLKITSSRPIRDPNMKFLVQVLWPNGRLLRQYSVLLDPPKATPQPAAAPAPAPVAQLPLIAPAPTPVPVDEVTPALAPAKLPAPTPAVEAKPTLYTTSKHDRLWDIAARVRSSGSVQQTMLAIQALNPGAFINGNINRLKVGEVLRLPDQQQIAATPQPEAVVQVRKQNLAWRQRRSLPSATRQVDATRHAKTEAAPAKIETKDNLSLVSGTSKSDKRGAAGDTKALTNQLAVAKENLDTTRRDNAELKSRMSDLQSQLDKLQRLIQLKNDQLAKMQAQGGIAPGAKDAATGAPALPAALVAATPAASTVVKPAAEIAPEDALPPAAEPTAVPQVAPIAPAPGGLVDNADTDSAISKLLASPMLLGLVGGGVLLILLLLLLFLTRRRRAQQEAEKHKRMARALAEESEFATDMDLPENSFDGLDVPPPNVKLAPVPASIPAPVILEPIRERSLDVLDQVAVHVANGRFNQAAELLEDAIKQEPQRSDLRLKLMEIYAEQGDRSGFTAQERKLVATGTNQAEVEELKNRFPMMIVAGAGLGAAALAAELDADYVKDLLLDTSEAPAVAPVPAKAPVPAPVVESDELDPFDQDFDLSLDELEDASPAIIEEPIAPKAEKAPRVEPGLGEPMAADTLADDDLSFESVLHQQNEAKKLSVDDLADFDLGLAEEPPSSSAEDDFLLSLKDDLRELPAFDDSPSLEPPAAQKPALPDDFDLSLPEELDDDATPNAFTTELDDVNAELDRLSQTMDKPPAAKPFAKPPTFTAEDALAEDDEPEFNFLEGTDEAATKLDLARAYIEMGDSEGARDILDEVVGEGDEAQKTEAREMLASLH
ncbi:MULTISPECIES: FimV/HubP family polar landmark protein [unclassified Pseudomonas]|uniref:FimV/HubP family polar landmark protein n=1 Tax=unclassified Pseudomonas TaxID=196821 RepID=UPI002AC96357|nr:MULTISPECIES: FimV/HubP family polar landmark protein [unclassified Pseudomonas]MEB0041883.1 FimV/HubP family polar landmark protein [Pseudomonas sp. MH10]MEB0122390.1 FimV/HubP family polar landmark protein [Pseudomonas sp. CCI1.2]WPX64004.1 FimV/HubP family polar landmark protein [Pseudomonas sp. MH10]